MLVVGDQQSRPFFVSKRHGAVDVPVANAWVVLRQTRPSTQSYLRADVDHGLEQSPHVPVCLWVLALHEDTLSLGPAVLVSEAGNKKSESFQIGVYGTSAMQINNSFFIFFKLLFKCSSIILNLTLFFTHPFQTAISCN